MRRTFVALALAGALLAGCASVDGAAGRDQDRRPGPTRVLLMGDSLTRSYHERTAELLTGYETLWFAKGGSGLLDSGICNGKRARDLRERYDPDIVVIEYIGGYGAVPVCRERVEYGSAKFVKRWRTSAARTQQAFAEGGAKVIWVLVPQTNPPQRSAPVIPELNDVYRSLRHKNADVVDAWTGFGATYNPSLHVDDGLHLNEAGVQKMAELINATVRSTPRSR